MPFLITNLREPVRAILGDLTPGMGGVRRYEDDAIDATARSMITVSRVKGYALTPDLRSVTPDLTGNDLALWVYEVCRTFIAPNVGEYMYATRALKERIGDQKVFFADLEDLIFELRNGGAMLATSLDFASWMQSVSGLNIWAHLTDMNLTAPIASVSLGTSGIVLPPVQIGLSFGGTQ